MTALPAKNILDGSKVPATSTAEMKAALGQIRDYLAALLGDDSDNTAAARNLLGVTALLDAKLATTGGTLSGALVLPPGTVSAPGLRVGASANTGVYSPSSGQIALASSGVQGMVLDSGGRVRKPTNPHTRFYRTGDGVNYVTTNQGGHFNASTGLFTCPVDGVYLVTAIVVGDGVGRTLVNLRVNGATPAGFTGAEIIDTTDSSFSTSLNVGSSVALSLAANDTISMNLGALATATQVILSITYQG